VSTDPNSKAGRCEPPDFETFDIDVHDCPCGHMYGDHDYEYVDGKMHIAECLNCPADGRTDG